MMRRSVIAYANELGYDSIYIMSGEHGLYEKYGFSKLGNHEAFFGGVDQLFVMKYGIVKDFLLCQNYT